MQHRIIESTIVVSPIKALDALTSKDGAKFFRDIKKYTSYDVDENDIPRSISMTYKSGIPFSAPISVKMWPMGKVLMFNGTGPFGITFTGSWVLDRTGVVVLDQRFTSPRWTVSLIQRRTKRVLEDLRRMAF